MTRPSIVVTAATKRPSGLKTGLFSTHERWFVPQSNGKSVSPVAASHNMVRLKRPMPSSETSFGVTILLKSGLNAPSQPDQERSDFEFMHSVKSHTRNDRSALAVATRRPSGSNTAWFTGPLCFNQGVSGAPERASHTRAVPPWLPVSKYLPSGLKETHETWSRDWTDPTCLPVSVEKMRAVPRL